VSFVVPRQEPNDRRPDLRYRFGVSGREGGTQLAPTSVHAAVGHRSPKSNCWPTALEVCCQMINNFEQASWHDCSLDALPTRDGRRMSRTLLVRTLAVGRDGYLMRDRAPKTAGYGL
jgi:hypothetical protein